MTEPNRFVLEHKIPAFACSFSEKLGADFRILNVAARNNKAFMSCVEDINQPLILKHFLIIEEGGPVPLTGLSYIGSFWPSNLKEPKQLHLFQVLGT